MNFLTCSFLVASVMTTKSPPPAWHSARATAHEPQDVRKKTAGSARNSEK